MLRYLVVLRSEQTGVIFNILSLDSEENNAVVGNYDGLEDNHIYIYTVTAMNSVGNSTSDEIVIGR